MWYIKWIIINVNPSHTQIPLTRDLINLNLYNRIGIAMMNITINRIIPSHVTRLSLACNQMTDSRSPCTDLKFAIEIGSDWPQMGQIRSIWGQSGCLIWHLCPVVVFDLNFDERRGLTFKLSLSGLTHFLISKISISFVKQ